jgi:succinate dehydrogenase/fumarate reductase cytochrome b subunit
MPAKTGWPAVLHTALGVLLGGFALFHGYQNYPALEHPDAWLDRALRTPVSFGLGVAVLVAIAVHGLLGFHRWFERRRAHARGEAERDWGSGFQALTGVLVLGFVAFHVFQLWPSGAGTQSSVREPYARLWRDLGHPLYLVIYVAGVTALAFHVGHGLARALSRARVLLPNVVARALGGALGLVLLIVFAQLVARFALGEALIPALS